MNSNPFCVLSGYDEVQRISAQTASLFVPISRCCVEEAPPLYEAAFDFTWVFIEKISSAIARLCEAEGFSKIYHKKVGIKLA